MSSLVIAGDTSGSVTLQAPAVSNTTVLTLPATSGTVLTTASGTAATATNLAGGSNGTIPYQSAAGTTQMLAVGSSGQLLKSNGVAAPSWVTPSAGAVTLLGTVTASAASTLLVNSGFTSTYDTYDLVVYGTASVNNASISMRYELGGSIISTTTYHFAQFYNCLIGSQGTVADPTNLISVLNVGNSTQAAGNNFTVTFRITNPSSASLVKLVTWQGASVRSISTFNQGYSLNLAVTALTGLQFFPDSGTITATACLYGYSKT